MPQKLALSALENILPVFDNGQDVTVNFYGGEPLLETASIFLVLSQATRFFTRGNIHFAMTSNGVLLDERFLKRISGLSFDLIISHDGLWQQETRKGIPHQYSLEYFEELLDAHPAVRGRYNCVCPPNQIRQLNQNIHFFRCRTRRPVHFALDSISPWSEADLDALDMTLTEIHHKGLAAACPELFNPVESGVFVCDCHNRISIDPEGFVWGCYQYYDLFNRHPQAACIDRHRVGHLGMPGTSLSTLLRHWPACHPIEQDQCLAGKNACLICDQLLSCSQCPVNGAYATGEIGRLPPWLCRIQRILQKHREGTR